MDEYKTRDALRNTKTACRALSVFYYAVKGDKDLREAASHYMDFKELEKAVWGLRELQSVLEAGEYDE